MSTRFLRHASVAFVLLGALVSTSSGCEQSKPKCTVGRGDFAVKFRVVAGAPTCGDVKGDTFGLQAYNPPGEGNRPDLERGTIAIQSLTLGTLNANAEGSASADPDPTHHPYALGAFSSAEPDGADFCHVPTFAPAVQSLGAIAADEENEIAASPATNVTYDWKNFRVYVTPGANGTQFTADLTLTTDGVACSYSVVAMYPAVPCGKADPADPTGNAQIPDDTACNPEPDPANDRPTGSGINPDFPTRCDPDLLQCFLTSENIPALK